MEQVLVGRARRRFPTGHRLGWDRYLGSFRGIGMNSEAVPVERERERRMVAVLARGLVSRVEVRRWTEVLPASHKEPDRPSRVRGEGPRHRAGA